MSANLTPVVHDPSHALAPMPPGMLPAAPGGYYGAPEPEQQAGGGISITRLLAALKRFKWLVLALTLLGAVIGTVLTRFVDPKYDVRSTLLLTAQGDRDGAVSGPIREEQRLSAQAWIDLARSFAIADTVVMQLSLYITPSRAADSTLFRNFHIDRTKERFIPGRYRLEVEGPRYTLRDDVGIVNENGIVGDSVGRTAGFAWRPSRRALGTDRTVDFTVRTPRETSVEVLQRLRVKIERGSNIITFNLTGTPQQKPAETLNAWGDQFVRIATEIKTARVAQFSRILNTQRADAAEKLTAAERAYQQFRVATIALPNEGVSVRPGAAGVEVRSDPALDNYFQKKYELDNIRTAREQVERLLPRVTATETPVEAILSVPAVNSDPAAVKLQTAVRELIERQQQMRVLLQKYTPENPAMAEPTQQLRGLQASVPGLLSEYLTQLRRREAELGGTVSVATSELQGIPSRTIQQEALRREVEGATALYNSLQARFSDAELAEKSMTPDVRVLDRAVMPLEPTNNTAVKLIALALAGGLGAGLGLSILLDRLDRRFRYPHQATSELGLQVLGVVPEIDQTRQQTPEQVAQVIESFRTIRMNARYACMPAQKVALTITSPGANDGKSLVSSNLALSFAEGGWRTVLIDGDLRRGQLHATFDLPSGPGLIEYLEGTSLLGEVVHQTHHDSLALIPTGMKHRRGPELLATPRMQQLIATLAQEFDAIIVDTPPLGAGTDAYAIGTATQHLAIVLRSEATDLKLAQAKLQVLDQLPVNVIGVVLNEIRVEGSMYHYYSYDPEYALVESSESEEQQAQITAGR
jgi:capsular exopolysaccharide synthesis family protein